MNCKVETSLLDYLYSKLGLMYLSDLHFLDNRQKKTMHKIIRKIDPQEVSLRDWNNTLEYFSGKRSASEDRNIIYNELIESIKVDIRGNKYGR